MILYLRYCRTGVLFHITVHVKDQYVTTYDDVILVKPNRICICHKSQDTKAGTSLQYCALKSSVPFKVLSIQYMHNRTKKTDGCLHIHTISV